MLRPLTTLFYVQTHFQNIKCTFHRQKIIKLSIDEGIIKHINRIRKLFIYNSISIYCDELGNFIFYIQEFSIIKTQAKSSNLTKLYLVFDHLL